MTTSPKQSSDGSISVLFVVPIINIDVKFKQGLSAALGRLSARRLLLMKFSFGKMLFSKAKDLSKKEKKNK